MLRVASRKDLEEVAGRAPAKPAAPEPTPAPPPAAEPHPGMVQMQAAVAALADAAAIMAASTAALAQPRNYKATIIRDDNQRMKEVIFNRI